MKIIHCRVLKPFDRYDTPGGLASLSENGFARFANSKMRDYVEVLCIEHDNGDVADASGNVVLEGATRKGAAIDPFTIDDTKKAGVTVDVAADREEKKSKTR